jgi:hypothetical protein
LKFSRCAKGTVIVVIWHVRAHKHTRTIRFIITLLLRILFS